jgi:N-acyl amino acid synthase FeeM
MRKLVSKLVGRPVGIPPPMKTPTVPKTEGKMGGAPATGAPVVDVTGQTVYGDRALRFRSLTLREADLPALEDSTPVFGAFKIRLAKRTGARRDAGALVERRYGHRGYAVPVQQPESNVLTFIAYDEGQIVGTVGVALDVAEGLPADDIYSEELDQLRRRGNRLCEFTRLAVDGTAASKPVLAGLFQTAYLYAALIRGFTHAVIEINPRHVGFYQASLKFESIGQQRMNRRVNAPAVLLCASFDTIAADLRRHAGRTVPPGVKRTLFHYGFAPDEETGVLTRLRELMP